MRDFMTVARALADESRVRVALALNERELCVCEIVELLGLAPSTVSKHLAILAAARVVDARKDGRWIYYRLAGEGAPPEVRRAIEWVLGCLVEDDRAREDAKRVAEIIERRVDACET